MINSRIRFRTTAALALVGAFGLSVAGVPASAQMLQQDTQGVTPQDQTGGTQPQALPDDDTVLRPGAESTEGQAGVPVDAPPPAQGVAPQEQASPGVPAGTMPADDTLLQQEPVTARQVIVLPDGTRIDASEGSFIQLDDGSLVWEHEGLRYPVVSADALASEAATDGMTEGTMPDDGAVPEDEGTTQEDEGD